MAQRLQEAFEEGKLDQDTFVSLLRAAHGHESEVKTEPPLLDLPFPTTQADTPAQGTQHINAYPPVPSTSFSGATISQPSMSLESASSSQQKSAKQAPASSAEWTSNKQDLGTVNDFFLKLGQSVAMELQTYMQQNQSQEVTAGSPVTVGLPTDSVTASAPTVSAVPGQDSIYPAVPAPQQSTSMLGSAPTTSASGLLAGVLPAGSPARGSTQAGSSYLSASPGSPTTSAMVETPSSGDQSASTPNDSPSPATPFSVTADTMPFSLKQLEEDGLTSILGFDPTIFNAPVSDKRESSANKSGISTGGPNSVYPLADEESWRKLFGSLSTTSALQATAPKAPDFDQVQTSASCNRMPPITTTDCRSRGVPDQFVASHLLGRASLKNRPGSSPSLPSDRVPGKAIPTPSVSAQRISAADAASSSSRRGRARSTSDAATYPLPDLTPKARQQFPSPNAKHVERLKSHASLIRAILIQLNRPSMDPARIATLELEQLRLT